MKGNQLQTNSTVRIQFISTKYLQPLAEDINHYHQLLKRAYKRVYKRVYKPFDIQNTPDVDTT